MPSAEARTAAAAASANAMAFVYAAGALVLLVGYELTPLTWQHGWQYGVGMGLIAIALLAYARSVTSTGSPFRSQRSLDLALAGTVLQAVAAAVGLVWLVTSGKLTAGKSDWLANAVFVLGGLALIAISVSSTRTQARLRSGGS